MSSELPTEVLGQFHVEGTDSISWPGVLTLGSKPDLRLLIISDSLQEAWPAALKSLRDGAQPNVIGVSSGLGYITLIECAELASSWSFNCNILEVTLVPTEIWVGPRPFGEDKIYQCARLRFSGIHSIIGGDILAQKLIFDFDDKKNIKDILGNTSEVFYRNPYASPTKISIYHNKATIEFYSRYTTSISQYDGKAISTWDECKIELRDQVAWRELVSICMQIEDFLSFICLRTINYFELTLEQRSQDDLLPERYKRLWYRGFKPSDARIMAQEALGTFRADPAPMQVALNAWLSPSDEQQLARSLFLESQDQNIISIGRFITICQAVEIIGRRAKSGAPFEKAKFSEAASVASEAICHVLGHEYESLSGKITLDCIAFAA